MSREPLVIHSFGSAGGNDQDAPSLNDVGDLHGGAGSQQHSPRASFALPGESAQPASSKAGCCFCVGTGLDLHPSTMTCVMYDTGCCSLMCPWPLGATGTVIPSDCRVLSQASERSDRSGQAFWNPCLESIHERVDCDELGLMLRGAWLCSEACS